MAEFKYGKNESLIWDCNNCIVFENGEVNNSNDLEEKLRSFKTKSDQLKPLLIVLYFKIHRNTSFFFAVPYGFYR